MILEYNLMSKNGIETEYLVSQVSTSLERPDGIPKIPFCTSEVFFASEQYFCAILQDCQLILHTNTACINTYINISSNSI
jgi:hypothetical protein